MTRLLCAIILVSGAALTAGITTDDANNAKRTVDYSQSQPRAQSRRIQAGSNVNHFYNNGRPGAAPLRRARPSLPAPPYAVQMEPLVQYSQRDPLYHQRQELANLTRDNSIDEKVHRIDHDSEGTNLAESYGYNPNFHPHYYQEPEPIIEIIIKESNESLPAPPPPPIQPVIPTKEPVHVFYVKYKKNPKGKGEDDIIYEAPIPAITPPTNHDEIEHEHDSSPQVSDTVYETATASPPPSTTLRTVIHPDSEIYHGSGLKVTFGETELKTSDATYEESNSPSPSIALPKKEAQSRESNTVDNSHTSIKRQGIYQTIPQEIYDQNPPKVTPSASIPTFQSPVGRFQQNSFQQQNPQPIHYHQTQQNKVNFPRQAPAQQPPAFRPQHTGSLLNNAQHNHQQQLIQRPSNHQHHQQFQPQASTSNVQQRQVPRQQGNVYSTLQSPTQNSHQKPQFRGNQPQFEQRPIQYSQPLNNPQQFQRQQPVPSQHSQPVQQQQVAQQQAVQSQFRTQPINVPNQEPNRFNQPFPASQPLNTPLPLPSKPIHPLYAHHYQQQISVAQQQRHNFIPSTHQPQQQLISQQFQPIQQQQPQQHQQQPQQHQQQQQPQQHHQQPQQYQQQLQQHQQQSQPQQHQQQYRIPQPTINIPRQPSTTQPLQSYELTSPSPPDEAKHSVTHFHDGQIIKSISQSEEHQLQPQFNQHHVGHINPQPTVDQINQLNQQLRSQQIAQQQYNQQLTNQQQINQQLVNQQTNKFQQYNQQLQLQQQNQQQFENGDLSSQQYTAKQNQQRPAHYSHPNQLVSTTSQPIKSTTVAYQTKYNQIYSQSPSTTPTPTEETPTSTTEDPKAKAEKEKKFKENLAALPDEVPEDIREQLLSSGILSNADISILDYDKVGDIPIENLPPEALENFYGAGSAPVPAIVAPDSPPVADSTAAESKDVEMKVVRYDPSTQEGQKVEDSYIKDDATQVDSVILNDSKYNRYLPLKVSGVNFPLPDTSILAGKKVNSVVVLAPVDYDFVKQAEEEEERTGRSAPVQVQGVRFIAGNILKTLIKDPTEENYKNWLTKERSHPADRQSVVLLVVSPEGSEEKSKEIFMYDINSEKLSRLRGELSSTFVEVAESNASSQELDGLSDTEVAASSQHAVRVPGPASMLHTQQPLPSGLGSAKVASDLDAAASETEENAVYQAPTISTGYSKMAVQ